MTTLCIDEELRSDIEMELENSDGPTILSVPLGEEHKRLMDDLLAIGAPAVWENGRLKTHTAAIAQVFSNGGYRGVFKTTSPGTDLSSPNCFAYPKPDGAWLIVRYPAGQQVAEADTWQHGQSTTCWFNRFADFDAVMKSAGGAKMPDGSYQFSNADKLPAVEQLLAVKLEIPGVLVHRKITLAKKKTDLVATIERGRSDAADLPTIDWPSHAKGYVKVFDNVFPDAIQQLSDILRCGSVTPEKKTDKSPELWFVRIGDRWLSKSKETWREIAGSETNTPYSLTHDIAARAARNPYNIVHEPFKPEYSPERPRDWNLATQLIEPAWSDAATQGYDSILQHVGCYLDRYVLNDEWCTQHQITSGADYLFTWAAYLVQRPEQHLPYLAFVGEQNSGKSTFASSLHLLMSEDGFVDGRHAALSQGEFNGEFAGVVLLNIEETNLRKVSNAYARIKQWTVDPYLQIHPKGATPYKSRNYLHFIQTANSHDELPVFEGDKRVVVVNVDPLTTDIPWETEFRPQLVAEAPFFLRRLLGHSLPSAIGRFALPVIDTRAKLETLAEDLSKEDEYIAGSLIDLAEDGKLAEWTEYSQIKSLLPTVALKPSTQWWSKLVERIKSLLQVRGWLVEHRKGAGHTAAAWRLTPRESEA